MQRCDPYVHTSADLALAHRPPRNLTCTSDQGAGANLCWIAGPDAAVTEAWNSRYIGTGLSPAAGEVFGV
jgi:hypothetical protein